MQPKGYSIRDQMRDAAERVLKEASGPMHNSQLASEILPTLGIGNTVTPKTLNTSLHDDPKGRFRRVGPGTWTLVR
jgi:hypothetical protein